MNDDKIISNIEELKIIKQVLIDEVIELDDRKLFQEFGVYKPQYSFANSEMYKERLSKIRNEQEEMIKNKTAAICTTEWQVQGDKELGKKMIAESIKLIIRNFNIECDLCINKVKFSNYENSKKRILQSFMIQNQLHETQHIYISDRYFRLKIQELNLAYEYQLKKKEEKEEIQRKKEELREAARVAKEIEEKRKELEKEKIHYQRQLDRVNVQIDGCIDDEDKEYLLEKKERIERHSNEINIALTDLDYREANQRAGYVYIISNIGAFGENIYKIGMTRRLEPEDRIAELSGASVPFRFDIHAMIFSDDAPKLEAALHREFADKKVNLVNGRKEFFNVTLEEIKKVVQENHDKTVEFINEPDAQQYRETIMLRRCK